MKLARKLTFALSALACVVLAAHTVFEIKSEWEGTGADMREDHLLIGRALAGTLRKAWLLEGEAAALSLLAQTSRYQEDVQLRWVWLDDAARTAAPWLNAGQLGQLRPGGELTVEVGAGAKARLATYISASVNGRVGAIEVSQSLADRQAALLRRVRSTAWATVALFLLFLLVASWLGSRLVGRPVEALTEHARRIARGEFTGRVTPAARDELGALAAVLNEMTAALSEARVKLDAEIAARLRAMEALRHADRLTTVGKLAAGVAHELGTPLNVVYSRGKMIGSGEETAERAKSSGRIIAEQAQAMTKIIRQLLEFARRRMPARRSEDLGELAARTVELIAPLAQKKDVRISVEGLSGQRAEVDGAQLQQVLTNLLVNAIHATPKGGGAIRLSAQSVRAQPPADVGGPERDVVRLDVEDQGTGISPEIRAHLFEPFFTTKDVGEGTGLGLSVSYGIVRDHDGWISVETGPGRGSRFSVFLPRSAG